MKKCKNADNYKGLRKPTCNKGYPCDTCNAIWEAVTKEYDIQYSVKGKRRNSSY